MTPVWLVLPDPFSSRLFFDTGIVERLHHRLGERLELFLLDTGEQAAAWTERADPLRTTNADQLKPRTLGLPAKVTRRADTWLDRRIGFYPLSLRHSLRSGFNSERMQPGHLFHSPRSLFGTVAQPTTTGARLRVTTSSTRSGEASCSWASRNTAAL